MEKPEKNLFETLNTRLIETFSSSPKLNYCRFLLPEKEGQVSLVAKYAPCYSPDTAQAEPFVALCVENGTLTTVESRDYGAYYYGVSPAIDDSVVIEAMVKGMLTDEAGLEAFIKENSGGFMLHRNQEKYLLPCAKLFTLSIAHLFGIKVMVDTPLYDRLLSYAETTMVEKGGKEGQLLLCGSPTEDLFRELDEYRFTYDAAQTSWVCRADGEHSLRNIYKDKNNIILLKGHTFYSGALLRILYIKDDFISYGNDTVSPLQFLFERSSYATVYTFDNNYTNHPLLSSCRELLEEMYRSDDGCKRALGEDTRTVSTRAAYIDAVNRYLKNSSNVNQMGVTGNLITSDGILLIGERESGAIDAGEIYPSVNGNAEVIDPNVRFYKLFANEDYPTIALDANRIDFYGELNREAYAELSITTRSDAWQCYGFTLSGIVPPDEPKDATRYPFPKRRMHFNILCQQVCADTFEQIVEKQKTATEAFENRDLKGLALFYYPSRWKMFWQRLLNSCRVILENESNVMTLAAVYVFISTIIAAAQNGSLTAMTFSLSDILSAVFSLLGAVMLVVVGRKAIKNHRFRKKHITKLHIVEKGTEKDFSRITKYFSDHSCHPVAYAAVLSHILKSAKYK